MKIYTGKGDGGNTSLIGGNRVPKDHIRIEAYGTVDELNSWLGLLRDVVNEQAVVSHILRIQNDLFTIGSLLAAEEGSKMKLPELNPQHIKLLENSMDEMDAALPPMRNFVLPGGHLTVSHCHIARCVCRRAERRVVSMMTHEISVPNDVIQYLNRLSDWLFLLSRKCSQDLKSDEIPWIPGVNN